MAKTEFRLGGGLNLQAGNDAIGDDELLQARGVRYDEFGTITSSRGRNLVKTVTITGGDSSTGYAGDAIYGLGEFILNKVRYLAFENHHRWGYIAYATPYAELGFFTSPPTIYSDGIYESYPMVLLTYKGISYITNGYSVRRVASSAFAPAVEAGGDGYAVGDTVRVTGGFFGLNKTNADSGAICTIDAISGGGGTGPATTVSFATTAARGKYTEFPLFPAATTKITGAGNDALTVSWLLPLTLVEKIGLTPPTTAATLSNESAGGGSFAAGVYKWVYTFFNGIAESNFSPEAEHTFAAGSKGLDITGIASASGADAATLARRLYRTDNNGDSFFFITEIADNTTNAFTDALSLPLAADSEATSGDEITDEQRREDKKRLNAAINDAKRAAKKAHTKFNLAEFLETYYDDTRLSTGDIVMTNLGMLADWNNHGRPLTDTDNKAIRNVIQAQDYIFGIKDNNQLVFSNFGNAEQYDTFDRIRIGRDTADNLLDLHALDRDIVCLTEQGVWVFTLIGADATNSTLTQITSPVGTVGPQSASMTERWGLIFMGEDGIYRFDGREVTKVSQAIDDIFRNTANTDYVDRAGNKDCVMAAKGERIWISYYSDGGSAASTPYVAGTTFNNRTLSLDMSEQKPKWGLDSVGYTSLFRGFDGTIWGGDNSNQIWKVDESDGSTAIQFTVQTKYFPISSSFKGDAPDTLMIDADFGNVTTTIVLLGDAAETIMTWTVTGSNGRTKHRKLVPLGKIYDRMSVKISSSGNAERKVYGVAFITDDGRLE